MLEGVDGDTIKGAMEDDDRQSASTDEGAWHDGGVGEKDCRDIERK